MVIRQGSGEKPIAEGQGGATAAGADGRDVTVEDIMRAAFWTDAVGEDGGMGWDGVDTWCVANDRLPVLFGFGDPNGIGSQTGDAGLYNSGQHLEHAMITATGSLGGVGTSDAPYRYTYTGSALDHSYITVSFGQSTLIEGTDYELSITAAPGTQNMTNTAFAASISITGKGYYTGSKTIDLWFQIVPKSVSATNITASKVFDGTATFTAEQIAVSTATINGLISSDAGAVVLDKTYAVGTAADASVGESKPLSITGLSLSGDKAANYTLTSASGTASITENPDTPIVPPGSNTGSSNPQTGGTSGTGTSGAGTNTGTNMGTGTSGVGTGTDTDTDMAGGGTGTDADEPTGAAEVPDTDVPRASGDGDSSDTAKPREDSGSAEETANATFGVLYIIIFLILACCIVAIGAVLVWRRRRRREERSSDQ
jgi:hypothetical protein